MGNLDYKEHYRRNLPHIQPPGATLFVTPRLTGSIPRDVLDEWAQQKARFDAELRRLRTAGERQQREREWRRDRFARLEKYLDQAESGPKWLADPRLAKQVAESMHFRDGKVYELIAYCIMPNHVHIVFTPLPVAQAGSLCGDAAQANSLCYNSLASIMHSLKGRTAREGNRLLCREGAFWEHESYDHYVRDEGEFERIILYVIENPVKAGLVRDWKSWPWTYCRLEPWHKLLACAQPANPCDGLSM